MESFESFNVGTGENQTPLLSKLSFIQQLVAHLQNQLKEPSSSTIELSKRIVSQVLFETEKSISLAKSCGFGSNQTESISPPRSVSGSPRSDTSDLAFKGQDNTRKEVNKKRKTQLRWKNQVRVVGSIGGGEGPLDDGYSWRKYGQKDILGAKHPRGYYRCTHRNSQSCLATKQVQRTDADPAVFDVIYQGTHTCLNKSRTKPNTNNNNNNNYKQVNQINYDDELLNSLKATLTVKTEGSGSMGLTQAEGSSTPFSFPSTPVETGHVAHVDNCFLGNNFLPSFANSPATSESNYFSISPCTISGYGMGFQEFGKVDCDLAEVVSALSAAGSTTNSAMGDANHLMFDDLDFDNNFSHWQC